MILLCYFKNKTTPLLISCLPTTTPKEESNQQPIEYRKLFFPVLLINQIHERTVKISYFSLLELEPYVIYENMQLNQALFLLAKNIDF